MKSSQSSDPLVKPRIILHGGAGNITRENLPPHAYEAYKTSLLAVLQEANDLLQIPGATALDVATHAVALLENDPLFNAGKGAVFTRAGTIELESSIMVSRGYRKRAVGCMLLKRVKNPIKLAREMLIKGERDGDGGGAYGHCQLSGPALEQLAEDWGLEMCENEYFFTKRRWEEHKRGLERESRQDKSEPSGVKFGMEDTWPMTTLKSDYVDERSKDSDEYLSQGTVGAVVLDSSGVLCVATSTGGITNKVPGRIGDTPTIGAGFWAEEWMERPPCHSMVYSAQYREDRSPVARLSRGKVSELVQDCFPTFSPSKHDWPAIEDTKTLRSQEPMSSVRHAVAMSGTGNGDSFLRLNAVRTAGAISRFSTPNLPLAAAVTRMAGPNGELQRSAGDRWGRTGEGQGGIIGIELVGNVGNITFDFNCGMFRCWVDDRGRHKFMAFRDE